MSIRTPRRTSPRNTYPTLVGAVLASSVLSFVLACVVVSKVDDYLAYYRRAFSYYYDGVLNSDKKLVRMNVILAGMMAVNVLQAIEELFQIVILGRRVAMRRRVALMIVVTLGIGGSMVMCGALAGRSRWIERPAVKVSVAASVLAFVASCLRLIFVRGAMSSRSETSAYDVDTEQPLPWLPISITVSRPNSAASVKHEDKGVGTEPG